jgi:hypothetical protein
LRKFVVLRRLRLAFRLHDRRMLHDRRNARYVRHGCGLLRGRRNRGNGGRVLFEGHERSTRYRLARAFL